MPAFHEVQFPTDIAYGATGGPEYSTAIFAAGSGYEQRNANWSQARGRWDVGSGIRNRTDAATLIAFFRARKGRAFGFRFKDWSDYQGFVQPIGTGNGALTTFQLAKTYSSGGTNEVRTITKPVTGTVVIYKDAVPAASGWTVSTTTGIVTFSPAPANGVVITADFEFDVPVRFDTDKLDWSIETYNHGEWGQIPIVEVRV